MRELSVRRFAEFAEQGEPLGCYEVPLLVESGLADVLRPLVVVAVPVELQLERTVARGGISAADAAARIRAQLPLADKIAVADYVIDNSGPMEQTHARADAVLAAICTRLGVDAARYGLAAEIDSP